MPANRLKAFVDSKAASALLLLAAAVLLWINDGLMAVWVSVLKSGVHATLVGGVLAMFIPLKPAGEADEARPTIRLEHTLKPWSAWFIMPVFAFASAGLSLGDLSLASLVEPVPLGIVVGLFVGKQVGIVLGRGC
ncbi:MAG: Na+/H+ antiporter NhaA [Reyranella sp.]